jgi:peptidoglycan/xylan/chitin deacetylase (PgdA/CDA1 family)
MTTSRRLFLAGLATTASAAACSPGTADRTADSPRDRTPDRTAEPAPAPAPAHTSSAPGSQPPTVPPDAGGLRGDILHGPRSVAAVALTFHGAGEPALCRRVLAEAAAAHAHLTILAVGTWLRQNPTLAGAIVEGGHDLGNHTWSHLPMRRLSALEAHQEIRRGADLLVRLTGTRGQWFRPSGTARSTATVREAARSSGYPRCLAYDVDPLDYTDPGADAVTARVLQSVRPGSIVSLHLGHSGTAAALPYLLERLARRGLRAVTVSTLLGSAP